MKLRHITEAAALSDRLALLTSMILDLKHSGHHELHLSTVRRRADGDEDEVLSLHGPIIMGDEASGHILAGEKDRVVRELARLGVEP